MSTRVSKVFWILAGYFVLLGFIKLFGSLEYDDAEQALISTHLALGYSNVQPPLYNWLQWLFFELFGHSKAAIVFLKHLLLFGIYLAIYALAKELGATQSKALMALFLSLLLPQLLWQSELMLTHSVLATLCGVLFFWIVAKIYKKPSWKLAFLLGAVSAAGFLAKYSFALLLFAFLLLWLADSELRARFKVAYLLLSFATFLFLSAPHLWWVAQHWQEVSHATLAKTIHHKNGLIELLKSFVLFLTPLWIAWIFVVRSWPNRLERRLLTMEGIVLALLVLLVILGLADSFKERWLLPFFTPLPALLASTYEERYLSKLQILGYALLVGMLLFFIVRIFFPPRPTNSNLPIQQLAQILKPQKIQSSNLVLGGNFALYLDPNGKRYQISSKPKAGYAKICLPYLHSHKEFCLYYKEIK